MLSRLCQKAGKRLRESGLDAKTATVTIRYAGFETITRAKTLPEPVHLDQLFLEVVRQLFDQHWDRRRAVRLVGVELGGLSRGANQLDLLDAARREKLDKLAQATDKLRDRFGFAKVQFGGSLGTDTDH
jgi:DNA polymerase-4